MTPLSNFVRVPMLIPRMYAIFFFEYPNIRRSNVMLYKKLSMFSLFVSLI